MSLNFAPFLRLHYRNKPSISLREEQRNALKKFNDKVSSGIYSFENVACLCGGNSSIIVAKKDRYNLPVETKICINCGLMRTSPRLSEQSLNDFYNEDYREIYVGNKSASEKFFKQQVSHGEKILDFVRDVIPNLENMTVFDIGCGAGGNLIPFREKGCTVMGCDLGEEYLQYGKNQDLTLYHGNVETLKNHGNANLIILSHVLEHFPKPLENLAEISEILGDNGYLYIEIPGILNIHNSYRDTLKFLQNAHLYHFTLSTLTDLLAKAGYRCIKGDEYICALFVKDKSVVEKHNSIFMKTIFYLIFMEFYSFAKKVRDKFLKSR